MNWIAYALISVLLFSVMTLIFKKATVMKLDSSIILMFVFLFGFLFYFAHNVITKKEMFPSWIAILILLVAAALSYGGNLFSVKALAEAPNPGFSEAIGASRLIIISLVAVVLFGSQMTAWNIFGIVLTVAGLVLLTVKF